MLSTATKYKTKAKFVKVCEWS